MPAVTIDSITLEPPLAQWPALLDGQPRGTLLGASMDQWRERTRTELDLPLDRRILATGHQPTLWHPGVLAKYIAVDAVAGAGSAHAVSLNVIVDQDVVNFAGCDVPVRANDGALTSRRIEWTPAASNSHVPVGWRPAFEPHEASRLADSLALPHLRDAVERIRSALAANASQPSAAAQVAAALARLMNECAEVASVTTMMASRLMRTTLAHALLEAMARDPHACAQAYNRSVGSVPQAKMTPLAIRDEYVELPLWRSRDNGDRIRAYDSEVETWLTGQASDSQGHSPMAGSPSAIMLLPRALLMTALLRIGVADVFVHGRGGAIYDRAMERWIRAWLGVNVSPIAVVSADVRLPLMARDDLASVAGGALSAARDRQRQLWHDPESVEAAAHHPGPTKQAMLREVERLPRRSHERRAAFFSMHQRLDAMRAAHRAMAVERGRAEIERLERLTADAVTARRRDWAFPLYPRELLGDLVAKIRRAAR